MKFKFEKTLLALGAVLLASVAMAAAFYVGYNPTTNQTGVNGIPVATGTMPLLGASTSCGTTATVQASMVGGSSVFQVTAGATTCTLQVNVPVGANGVSNPAPNGVYCVFTNETHPANIAQASHTTTSCTSTAATVTLADNILVEVNAY